MHPVLVEFSLGPATRELTSYGVALCVAWMVAFFGGIFAAHRAQQDVGKSIALAALVTACSFTGAHVLFVIVELVRGVPLPAAVQEGGRVLFGAIAGGVISVFVFSRVLGLDALRIVDEAVPWLAVAHAVGRLGCFFAGCCYGSPSNLPWAVTATDPRAPAAEIVVARHPVALYESIAMLACAGVLLMLRSTQRGQRALWWMASVCVVRAVVELFRGDAARGVFVGLGTSQILALLAGATLAIWAAQRRVGART